MRVLQEKAPRQTIDHYTQSQRDRWIQLMDPEIKPALKTVPAVLSSQFNRRLPSCLPAQGEHLDRLLAELGLQVG